MSGHTPGPWKRCGAARGGCTCGQVWSPDHPVAIVTRGEWGDGIDLRRALRELWDHFCHKGFGFLAYGHASDEVAQANACVISAAPDLLTEAAGTCAILDNYSGHDGETLVYDYAAIGEEVARRHQSLTDAIAKAVQS